MNVDKKDLYGQKRPSGLNVQNIILNEKLKEFLQSDEILWILMIIEKDELQFLSLGQQRDQLSHELQANNVFFGFVKEIINNTLKIMSFSIAGDGCSAIKRGKAAMYKSAALSVIPSHGELSITQIELLTNKTQI